MSTSTTVDPSPASQHRRLRRYVVPALVTGLLAGALIACGDDGSGGDKQTAASGPVSVVDHNGKRISLDAPAKRVATADWTNAEIALSLGRTPVGIGDLDTYRRWVGGGKDVPASVAPLGERFEPSLEKIAALRPDLILQDAESVKLGGGKLEKIAPTAGLDAYALGKGSPKTEWEAMREQTLKVGMLLGKEPEAKKLLSQTDAKIAEGAKRIKDAGRAGDSVVLAQTSIEGKPSTRLFDDGAQIVEAVRRLGLKNGSDAKHVDYSNTTVGLEGLRQVGDVDWLLYLGQPNDGKDELNAFRAWKDNPVYKQLAVVKAGHVQGIGGDNWPWGGPESMSLIAEKIADAVTASKSS
jgi:ferric hydroxamate transport system substrate-binding protein